MTGAALRRRRREIAPSVWAALADGAPGGRVQRRGGGVVASVLPGSPRGAIFNCVFYDGGPALLAALGELEAIYRAAGVAAWLVWVPAEDTETARALWRAGYALDEVSTEMGAVLDDLDLTPRVARSVAVRRSDDWRTLARLNAAAYGEPLGDWEAAFAGQGAALGSLYLADGPFGRPAAGAFVHIGDGNVEVCFVATHPRARGRGLAAAVLQRALSDARAAGCRTATLEATAAGRPVYARMGFGELGAMQLWQRRLNAA